MEKTETEKIGKIDIPSNGLLKSITDGSRYSLIRNIRVLIEHEIKRAEDIDRDYERANILQTRLDAWLNGLRWVVPSDFVRCIDNHNLNVDGELHEYLRLREKFKHLPI